MWFDWCDKVKIDSYPLNVAELEIVAEGSGHLGYDAALVGELVPMLRNIIVPSKNAPLQMKTLRSFETPGTTDPVTEPYVPEDLNPPDIVGLNVDSSKVVACLAV